MSFLGGPECSTGSNPLAQFQKQTGADTSLQRDRLASRPQQYGGFRTQQGPGDQAFQDFQQQGPGGLAELPLDGAYLEQLEREHAQILANGGGGGGGGGGGWAGEFAQRPAPMAAEFHQMSQPQGPAAFSQQDFANFRSQHEPLRQTTQSPQPAQSLYQHRSPMYGGSTFGGGGFGMQRPMMFQQSQQMFNPSAGQQQYEGKGKGRVQELSDTDWEQQFEELSTQDKEADLDTLDAEAEEAIEAELNQMDR